MIGRAAAALPTTARAASDPRFRRLDYARLLGASAWQRLPHATRRRFANDEAVYTGTMTLHASGLGRWFERFCRLIGSPLPPDCVEPAAATVQVEPDVETGGSRWIRRYRLPRRTVEICSVKAATADGELVERLALGLRMRLIAGVHGGALHFVSTGYYFELRAPSWLAGRGAALRVPLPAWGLPGRTHVIHRDLGHGRFRFTMTVRHRRFGELFRHDGIFGPSGGAS